MSRPCLGEISVGGKRATLRTGLRSLEKGIEKETTACAGPGSEESPTRKGVSTKGSRCELLWTVHLKLHCFSDFTKRLGSGFFRNKIRRKAEAAEAARNATVSAEATRFRLFCENLRLGKGRKTQESPM